MREISRQRVPRRIRFLLVCRPHLVPGVLWRQPQTQKTPPRKILNSIPGIKFVELKNSSVCCGGGGTYTITERELSKQVLKSKMKESEMHDVPLDWIPEDDDLKIEGEE